MNAAMVAPLASLADAGEEAMDGVSAPPAPVTALVRASVNAAARQAQDEAGGAPSTSVLLEAITLRVATAVAATIRAGGQKHRKKERALRDEIEALKSAGASTSGKATAAGEGAKALLAAAGEPDRWDASRDDSDDGDAPHPPRPSFPFPESLVADVASAHGGQPDELCRSMLHVANVARSLKEDNMQLRDSAAQQAEEVEFLRSTLEQVKAEAVRRQATQQKQIEQLTAKLQRAMEKLKRGGGKRSSAAAPQSPSDSANGSPAKAPGEGAPRSSPKRTPGSGGRSVSAGKSASSLERRRTARDLAAQRDAAIAKLRAEARDKDRDRDRDWLLFGPRSEAAIKEEPVAAKPAAGAVGRKTRTKVTYDPLEMEAKRMAEMGKSDDAAKVRKALKKGRKPRSASTSPRRAPPPPPPASKPDDSAPLQPVIGFERVGSDVSDEELAARAKRPIWERLHVEQSARGKNVEQIAEKRRKRIHRASLSAKSSAALAWAAIKDEEDTNGEGGGEAPSNTM